jgi:ABC-type multidrug transport system fused ATPase/permease subunit
MISKLRNKWRSTTIGRSARVLSRADQWKIAVVAAIQVALGILDLAGVAAIGVLGALAVSGVESHKPGNRVNSVLSLLKIDSLTFQNQIAILGAAAAVLLVGRTLLSIFFTRRILHFLSRRGAKLSATLVARLLSSSLLQIQSRSAQATIYALTSGVEIIMLRVLATVVALVSDGSLLIVMALGLFIVDPVIAISTVLLFLLIGLALYRLMHVKARTLGMQNSRLDIASSEKIIEVINTYRETVVRNRRSYYAEEIGKIRFELADTLAETNFMPYVSKYVIETTVVLGALVIGAAQFLLQDATHAVATLSVFLAAGTRIAPAVLRMQQGSVQIKGSLGMAGPTLDLIDALADQEVLDKTPAPLDLLHEGFSAEVSMENVSLTYPGKNELALEKVNVRVTPGSIVAFVGPSGAGKTSLIDVLLGVLPPDQGTVKISGLTPEHAVAKWPGAIAYVPQDVSIVNGTIASNISLGFPVESVRKNAVAEALEVAQMSDFVATLENSAETQVGERGAKISGGQRQRLGIARAMFTKPMLLVLDEATSSLDGETESRISESIQLLRGRTTVIMIAHRLSTVRNADQVIYMDKGRIIAQGTFEEVRRAVPDFDAQAKLMGL